MYGISLYWIFACGPGVEVKAGQPLKVKPDYEEVIHVSQVDSFGYTF